MNMMSIYYRSGAYKMTQGNSFHRGTTYSFHRGIVKGDVHTPCSLQNLHYHGKTFREAVLGKGTDTSNAILAYQRANHDNYIKR